VTRLRFADVRIVADWRLSWPRSLHLQPSLIPTFFWQASTRIYGLYRLFLTIDVGAVAKMIYSEDEDGFDDHVDGFDNRNIVHGRNGVIFAVDCCKGKLLPSQHWLSQCLDYIAWFSVFKNMYSRLWGVHTDTVISHMCYCWK